MIITCPSCSVSYTVDASAFGNASRTVKCTACGWQWVQTVAAPVKPKPATAAVAAQTLPDDGVDESSPAAEEKVAWSDSSGPEPAAAATNQPSPPAAEETTAEGETPAADEPEDAVDFEIEMASEQAEAEETATDLPPEPEVPPRPPWVAGRWVLAAVGAIATVAVLLCGLLLVRGPIVEAFPQSAGFYRLLGLSVDNAGAGLDIRGVTSSREWIDGQEVLIVSGTIVNVSTTALAVPALKVALYGDGDQSLQSVVMPAAGKLLLTGEQTRFEVRLPSPPEAAQRIKITFEREN